MAKAPPVAVGTWRTIHRDGRDWVANVSIEAEPVFAPGPGDIKWVAVIYRDPNRGAHYVRGESLFSLDDAIDVAFSLLAQPWEEPPVALPDPFQHKMATPDAVTAPVPFFEGREEIRQLVAGTEAEMAEEGALHSADEPGNVPPEAPEGAPAGDE